MKASDLIKTINIKKTEIIVIEDKFNFKLTKIVEKIKSKQFTGNDYINNLVKQFNMDVLDAHKIVTEICELILNIQIGKLIDSSEPIYREMNEHTAINHFWWYRFNKDQQNTDRIFYIRKSKDNLSYKSVMAKPTQQNFVKSVIEAMQQQVINGESLYTIVHREFERDFGPHIAFSYKYKRKTIDEQGEEIWDLPCPLLSKYLEDNIIEINAYAGLNLNIKEMKILSNDPQTHCFNYVDLNKFNIANKPTPRLDSWFTAHFEPIEIEAIRCLIYSIFIEKKRSRLGMYWFDKKGFGGKTTVLTAMQDAIDHLIGSGLYCSFNSKDTSKHASSMFYEKLVAFDTDVKNKTLILTDNYHKMTGGDLTSIDQKSVQAFSARLQVTPIMCGNIPLELDTSARHMVSRLIYIKMKDTPDSFLRNECILNADGSPMINQIPETNEFIPVFDESKLFVKTIQEEMIYWIANSKVYFDKLMPNGGNMNIPSHLIKNLVDGAKSEEQDLVDEYMNLYFVYDEKYFISGVNLQSHFFRYCSSTFNSRSAYSILLKQIENKGIKKTQRFIEGYEHRISGYPGIKLKDFVDTSSTNMIIRDENIIEDDFTLSNAKNHFNPSVFDLDIDKEILERLESMR